MKKLVIVMAIVLMASTAHATALTLINSFSVTDGQTIAFDAVTGDVITAHYDGGTVLDKYNPTTGAYLGSTGVVPGSGGVYALEALPNGNLLYRSHVNSDVVEITTAGAVVGAGISFTAADTRGIAIVDMNDFFLLDQDSGDVVEVDATGAVIGTTWNTETQAALGGSGCTDPSGMSFGPGGNLYVGDADGARVLEYETDGTFVAEHPMTDPKGLSYDPATYRLFVVHDSNTTVEVYQGPIPEPAGLGLVGLALLAVRKRRS